MLNNTVIPLIPEVKEEEYLYVTLSNTFNQGGVLTKYKMEVPKIHAKDPKCPSSLHSGAWKQYLSIALVLVFECDCEC